MVAHIASRGRWRAVVPFVAVLLAACGTTVPNAERRLAQGSRLSAGGGQGLDGAAAGADGGAGGGSAAGPALGATGGAAGFGGAGGTTAAGAARTGSGGSAGGATGSVGPGSGGAAGGTGVNAANAPGVTATTINVGLIYTVNGQAANAALGASGVTQGDEKANDQILIDDINAHGGVAGRKLVPVWHALDATSADTADSQFQAACDDFTQDHKVFVAFAGQNETFLQCMNSRGAITVEDNLTQSDAARFQMYPYYFEIGSMNLDRIAEAEVGALAAQNYFTGWDAAVSKVTPGRAKLGVLTFDTRAFAHATDQVLIPALAKLGYAPDKADVVKVNPGGGGQSDLGAVSAAVSNAVLKFRSDGVEHVIVFDAAGVLTILFLTNANSQHYFPRYGFNTQNGPQALADSGALPKEQLVGSLGIGWLPGLDVTPSENPDDGPYSNDARRRCLALLRSHGQTYSDANAETIALGTCNSFWFFQQVGNAMGGAPSRDAFRAAVNGVGSSFASSTVFGTFFGPNQHDGVSAYRYWAYDQAAGRMHYSGGNMASVRR